MNTKRILLVVLFAAVSSFAFMASDTGHSSAAALSQYYSPLPPPNDDFANATQITSLPYSDNQDTQAATTEAGEPTPTCSYGYVSNTIWYAYTATENKTISASVNGYYTTIDAIYSGSSLGSLTQLDCHSYYGSTVSVVAQAGTTYYFQVSSMYGGGSLVWFDLSEASPPQASYYYYPSDPSIYDTVQFSNNSYDPAGIGIETWSWNFGDGTTSTEQNPNHIYSADGDYTVTLTVTTTDGRTGTTNDIIRVRTHDVAITKFSVPNSASVGQTRQIVVGVNSKLLVDRVVVDIYRSTPYGYQLFGSLTQEVPVRSSNRTTDFSFSYTFTGDDARVGKVTFKAIAQIENGRDALSADNEAVSAPVKIGNKGAKDGAFDEEATKSNSVFLPLVTSN